MQTTEGGVGKHPVQGQGQVKDSEVNFTDSGLELSLLSTPAAVDAKQQLDISMESGEITDNDAEQQLEQDIVEFKPFACYTARSLAERLVLDDPPVPPGPLTIRKTPDSRSTLITDRVGAGLTRCDKVIVMQNDVAKDFWVLAQKMENGEIQSRFRYIFVMIGLDWCLSSNKTVVKEGLRRVLRVVQRQTNGNVVVGVIGVTPNYDTYAETKVKMVTFNRCLQDTVRECNRYWRVEFLPLHLHFLEKSVGAQPAKVIQPLGRYFNDRSEFTLTGGLVLREMLLKAMDIIPMDGQH